MFYYLNILEYVYTIHILCIQFMELYTIFSRKNIAHTSFVKWFKTLAHMLYFQMFFFFFS